MLVTPALVLKMSAVKPMDIGDFDIPNHTSDNSRIVLTEEQVLASLARIDPKKAVGPDGLRGRVLTSCRYQLKGVITKLFQLLLDAWKFSIIIPIPRRPRAKELHNFRPVAFDQRPW